MQISPLRPPETKSWCFFEKAKEYPPRSCTLYDCVKALCLGNRASQIARFLPSPELPVVARTLLDPKKAKSRAILSWQVRDRNGLDPTVFESKRQRCKSPLASVAPNFCPNGSKCTLWDIEIPLVSQMNSRTSHRASVGVALTLSLWCWFPCNCSTPWAVQTARASRRDSQVSGCDPSGRAGS